MYRNVSLYQNIPYGMDVSAAVAPWEGGGAPPGPPPGPEPPIGPPGRAGIWMPNTEWIGRRIGVVV
jgi:hypothetical protein